MNVFKTFFKVLNKYKFVVLMYTIILLFFGAFNYENNDTNTTFTASKPDVAIVSRDNGKITNEFVDYLSSNSNIIKIKEEKLDDALFYRDVNYVVYIPDTFSKDIMAGENPTIDVKSTGDYQASLAAMMVEKFMRLAKTYVSAGYTEDEVVNLLKNNLDNKTEVVVDSKLDTDMLGRAVTYYNFASYSLMAGAIYVISLVLNSFKNENILKRTTVSSTNYKEINRKLLWSNLVFSIVVWFMYVVLSIVLVGTDMISLHGLVLMFNTLLFSILCAVIAMLISNVVKDKNAINGIVNCLALGSAFLCGAFVPQEWLPTFVLNIAHALPTYWFISSNELLKNIEVISLNSLKPVLIDMGILVLFIILFIILNNLVSKKKQKIA